MRGGGETRYHFSMSDHSNEEFSGLTLIQDDDNDLTCEVYDEFHEALDTLYIQRNLSGRLNFLEAWPVAAQYLFGDELIENDSDGAKDLERRAVLEEEAEDRRIALLEIVENIHENSVHKGALQVEYVDETLKGLGRGLALLLYSEKIVNRFIPSSGDAVPEVTEQVISSSAVPQNPTTNIPDDIDVESLELGQPNDDMASLNKIGGTLKDPDERPRPSKGAFAPVDEPPPMDTLDAAAEDALDAIQPISVGSEVPPDAVLLPQEIQEPEPKADGPPMSPEESEYFRPNQWANEGTPGAESGKPVGEIKNDAMSGMKVSQKMSFVPAKKVGDADAEEKPKSGIIPVIGGSAKKPQDEEE